MAVNKVEFGDQVVMDITDSTVSPEKLLSGETAYDRSGAKITGSLVTKDISIETKRSTGENVATISLDNTDYDIYAISEDEVSDLISGDQEETGNPVVLKTLIGGDAKSCKVDLLPIQDLHGYDHPWPAGGGKNKCPEFPYPYAADNNFVEYPTEIAFHGTTLSFTFSGSFSNKSAAFIIGYDENNTATYVYALYNWVKVSDGTAIQENVAYTNERFRFSISDTVNIKKFVLTNYPSFSNDTKFENVQIEEGATITDYAPYSNICPISGRTEASVKRTGVNLLDLTQATSGKAINNQGQEATVSNITVSDYIEIFPNTDYYITSGVGSSSQVTSAVYDENKNFLRVVNLAGSGTQSGTINTGNDAKYLRMNFYTSRSSEVMFSLGTTATSYEPYNGVTYTETLGSTVYGGNVDFVSGEGQNDYEYLNPTSVAAVSSQSGGLYYCIINSGIHSYNNANVISSHFVKGPLAIGKCYITGGGTTLVFVVPDQTITTKEQANTWLQNNNVQFAIPLATPTNITSTPTQISLLKGNNVISTDGDNIDITWQNIPDIEDITPIKPLDYSTSEQATGQKWIDGSDIYRRTFTGTIDSNTHGTTEIADFTNLQPIACNGWFMDTSGVGMALGYFPNSTSWASALHIDSNHKLILFTESALAAGTYYVTVDYIKTS